MSTSSVVLSLLSLSAAFAPLDDDLIADLRRVVEARMPDGARVMKPYATLPDRGVEVVLRNDGEGWIAPVGLRRYEARHVEEKWLAYDVATRVGAADAGLRSHVLRTDMPASSVIAIIEDDDVTMFVTRVHPTRELTQDEVADVVIWARELWGELTGDEVSRRAPELDAWTSGDAAPQPEVDDEPVAPPATRRKAALDERARRAPEPRASSATPHASSAPSADTGLERDATQRLGLARLGALGRAVDGFRAERGRMPSSARELVDAGFVDDPTRLVDPRGPALGEVMRDPAAIDRVAIFRLVDAWRPGPIATSDLPRDGTWLILTGDGEVYEQPVDPAWLGRYTPKRVDERRAEREVDERTAELGVYVSDGATDSGRRGVGVDAIVPGYTRHTGFIDVPPVRDLRPGDLIVTYDGAQVESVADLDAQLAERPAGERHVALLEVIRDGELLMTNPLAPVISVRDATDARTVSDYALWLLGEFPSPPAGTESLDDSPSRLQRLTERVLIGLLEMDGLEELTDAPGSVGWEEWAIGLRHARGHADALAFLDEAVRLVPPDARPHIDVLRARELRHLRRHDEALDVLDHVERGVLWQIDEELRHASADEREKDRAWMLGRLGEVWHERVLTLCDADRLDEAVDVVRGVADGPLDDDRKADVLYELSSMLFDAGAHRPAVELLRRAATCDGAPSFMSELADEIAEMAARFEAEVEG